MKILQKMIRLGSCVGLLVVLVVVLVPRTALAATCTSSGGGDWSSISWSGCTPGVNDDVVIAHNVTLDTNVEVKGLKINSGATFDGSSNTLTVGYFENNGGTFNQNTGTVAFVAKTGVTPGVYGSSASIDFNNVTIATGVDFGNGKGEINDVLTINNGGYVVSSKAPYYADGSTLKYNTGGTYTANEEWYPNTISGAGVPHHVEIGNGTTLSFGSSNTARTAKGNVQIDGTLQLSSASGGDLKVGGDWSGNGAFTPNNRAVEFNGSASQDINSATTWDYLIINNSSNAYGVYLDANQTVNQQLTLTDGLVYVKSNTLTIGSSGSVSGGSTDSFVVTYIPEERAAMASVQPWDVPASKAAPEHGEDQTGKVCKVWGSGAFTYPIGDGEGTKEYSPITFTPTSPNGLTVCFRVRDTEHPNQPNNLTDYLTRYWVGEKTAGSFTNYAISATFINLNSDVEGSTSNMLPKKWDGGFPWTEGGTMGAPTFTWSGLASLSDFTAFKSGTLAVTLAEFYAQQMADYVRVTWETVSEIDNRGFNLYRGSDPAGPDRQLNATLIPSQSQGSPNGFIYTWDDFADLVPGTTYYYWVEDVDVNGAATRHGPVSVDYVVPTAVTLSGVAASPAAGAGALPWLLVVAAAGAALGVSRMRR